MKKWNRRTRVVVLSIILALVFLAIYAAGVMLPLFARKKKPAKGGRYLK